MIRREEIEVLLVEDQATDAELTLDSLRASGLTNPITHVWDGAEALDFLFAKGEYSHRKVERRPGLILLDLQLPKVNGLEVLRRVKSDARTRTIPVVVLTSSDEEPDIRRSYELGANSFIVKPVDFERLVQAVSTLGYFWIMLNEPPV